MLEHGLSYYATGHSGNKIPEGNDYFMPKWFRKKEGEPNDKDNSKS